MADPRLNIRIGADTAELGKALKTISTQLAALKRDIAKPAKDNGLSKGLAAAQAQIKVLTTQLAEFRRGLDRRAADESLIKAQREITAEVRRRSEIEAQANQRNVTAARQLAAENARIAAKRADSIAAFSAATPAQLRTPQERTSAIGREQVLRRDAELRMLDINRRADAAEAKLAATRARLATSTKSAGNAARAAGVQFGTLLRAVAGFAATLGVTMSGAALAALSDEAQLVTSRLKLATRTSEEFNRAQSETFAIAQRTRTSLKSTAELYARIERSTRELGVNQETVLALTESINQAAQIGGGGVGAEAALFQLSQGLASGQLRGEELNSVLEQTPRLAQAVADGLDIPIGKLREYAKEGKLSAEAVLRALIDQRDELAAEFAEMPETIAGGFTRIRNAFLQYIATSQEAGTAAANVAKALKAIAENLPTLINAFVRLGSVVAAYLVTFKLLPALYRTMIALSGGLAAAQLTLAGAFAAAGTAGAKAMLAVRVAGGVLLAFFAGWQLGKFLQDEFLHVQLFGIALAQGLHKIAVRIQHYFETAGTRIKLALASAFNFVVDKALAMNKAISTVLERLPGPLGKAYAAAGRASRNVLQGMRAETTGLEKDVAALDKQLAGALATIDEGYGELADAAIQRHQQKNAGAAGALGDIGIPDIPLDPKGATSAFRADLELLRDSIDRALEELDRLYEEGELGLREYFQRKAALQTAAIDAAIAQAREELRVADTQEEQAKALVEIEKLQRDRAEVGPAIAREQAAAERELANALGLVKAEIAELSGQTGALAAEELKQELAAKLREFASDPEMQELLPRLFNLKGVRQQLDTLRDQVQQTIGDLRGTEELLAAQDEAGQLSPFAAEEQLQALRERSIEQLERYRAALAALYATSKDPEVLRQLQVVDTELARIQAAQQRLENNIKDQAARSLGQFFSDLATGAKSFKDAFLDMVRSFVQGVAQMIAQELALKAVRGIISAFGGTVAVQHTGGMAGTGTSRRVSPMTMALFAGAPRFHGGGLPGLRSDEVPAILQKGEEVLAKNDPRNVMNGGGRTGSGAGTRVINVIDPALVQDYLDSPQGEEAILNVIGRNPGRVKQVVG